MGASEMGRKKKHRSLPAGLVGWHFGSHRGLGLSWQQGFSGEHQWDERPASWHRGDEGAYPGRAGMKGKRQR